MYEKLLTCIDTINQWRKQRISNSNFLILAAAVVGIMGGIASSVFKRVNNDR